MLTEYRQNFEQCVRALADVPAEENASTQRLRGVLHHAAQMEYNRLTLLAMSTESLSNQDVDGWSFI